MLDSDAFLEALERGTYVKIQREANVYAFGKSGVWVVPAYRMNGQRLDAISDIGVPKEDLRKFLEQSR